VRAASTPVPLVMPSGRTMSSLRFRTSWYSSPTSQTGGEHHLLVRGGAGEQHPTPTEAHATPLEEPVEPPVDRRRQRPFDPVVEQDRPVLGDDRPDQGLDPWLGGPELVEDAACRDDHLDPCPSGAVDRPDDFHAEMAVVGEGAVEIGDDRPEVPGAPDGRIGRSHLRVHEHLVGPRGCAHGNSLGAPSPTHPNGEAVAIVRHEGPVDPPAPTGLRRFRPAGGAPCGGPPCGPRP
jgi:hypothetical protein